MNGATDQCKWYVLLYVMNNGTATAEEVSIGLSWSHAGDTGTFDSTAVIDPMNPAVIDENNAIEESSENDNSKTVDVSVP